MVSHNICTVDDSGDWNDKCCMAVAWCEEHGDLSIALTEHFEHKAKNQMAVYQSGTREGTEYV